MHAGATTTLFLLAAITVIPLPLAVGMLALAIITRFLVVKTIALATNLLMI